MKVFGLLENAQVELLAADPAVTPTGRVYMNTTTSLPKLYMGAAWLTFQMTGIINIAANATLGPSDEAKIVDASGGAKVITLPLASTCPNKQYRILKKDSSGNSVTVTASGSDKINGGTTVVLAAQYAHTTVASDGTQWWVI